MSINHEHASSGDEVTSVTSKLSQRKEIYEAFKVRANKTIREDEI